MTENNRRFLTLWIALAIPFLIPTSIATIFEAQGHHTTAMYWGLASVGVFIVEIAGLILYRVLR